MSARAERERLALDARLIGIGGAVVTLAIVKLRRATLGQCEAADLVPTVDDANYVRCTSTGVRIREADSLGCVRQRTVCPNHGYDPQHTPPLMPEDL